MTILDQLSPASYKGVPFLVVSASLSGGRKDVKHVYPNKDTQVIEDLGLIPKPYSLRIVITGEDYIAKRDALIRIFDEGGPGPLVHPFYGRIENMVARTYTLDEEMRSLGEARLSVNFAPTLDTGVPKANTSTLNNLASAGRTLGALIIFDVEREFGVTESFLGNFQHGSDLLADVVATFEDTTSFLQASADRIDEFANQINEFSNDVFSLVKLPVELADSINNLFISVNNLYPTFSATAAVLAGFFDFSGDINPAPVTAGQLERNRNAEVIGQAVQTTALSYAYLNTAQIDFSTTQEIDSAAQVLEQQYQKNINSPGLSNETKSALEDLRLAVQVFFDERKLTVRQVLDVYTPRTSVRLLAYQYYGSSDDGEALAVLNAFPDVAFISGDVKVLTE